MSMSFYVHQFSGGKWWIHYKHGSIICPFFNSSGVPWHHFELIFLLTWLQWHKERPRLSRTAMTIWWLSRPIDIDNSDFQPTTGPRRHLLALKPFETAGCLFHLFPSRRNKHGRRTQMRSHCLGTTEMFHILQTLTNQSSTRTPNSPNVSTKNGVTARDLRNHE